VRAQQREIAEYRVQADVQLAQSKITGDATRAFYDGNPARFQVPEAVAVEYLVLSTDTLIASEQVGADEINAYYESNISKYGEPEQRRASHILIAVKRDAGDAEKASARERAAQICRNCTSRRAASRSSRRKIPAIRAPRPRAATSASSRAG